MVTRLESLDNTPDQPEWEPYEALPNEFDFLPPTDNGPRRRGQRYPSMRRPVERPAEVVDVSDEDQAPDAPDELEEQRHEASSSYPHPHMSCCGIGSSLPRE